MSSQLHILFVEDNPDDVELILRLLRQGDFEVSHERVETAAEMRAALANQAWDLIICDYSLPTFNAPQALDVMYSSDIDLPFIIVSGTIGEETAVSALKAGANDFIVKGGLARLIPAIEREVKEAEVRRERRQREREMEAIASISIALRTAQTLDEILAHVLDKSLQLLTGESGGIWLYNPANHEMRLEFQRNFTSDSPMIVKQGLGLVKLAVEKKETIVSRNLRTDSRIAPEVRENLPEDLGGICALLQATDQAVGVMLITFKPPRELTGGELRVLNALTEIGGSTIHRVRLHEQTVEQLDRLDALRTIDLAIISSFDLHVSINVVLEKVIELLKIDAASMLLFKPGLGKLEYSAGLGFRTRAIESSSLHIGEGMSGQVAYQRRTLVLENLLKSPEHARDQMVRDENFVSYAGVPLIAKGEVKGVLEVFNRSTFRPTAEWLNFFETLASQAAIAIDNVLLFENLQKINFELALAYDQTLEGWSRALDLRDKETEGHTQRVTQMTLKLAQSLGIHDNELLQIQRGALLHDIGKMGIPDNILLKPGPLTDEEWVVMKKHPTYAYEMLSSINYLHEALTIPYCHHEKWDGTGYPRGLQEKQIPLAARIFAVVDVWDALTNDRPYRPAWKKQDVIKYIQEQAGKHFDSEITSIFLQEFART